MIKNILKYSLFGLAASFAFAAFTIYLLEPREKLISELPRYWQAVWLVLLNIVGIFSHFAARFSIPLVARVSKNYKKAPVIFLAVFVVIVFVLSGGKYGARHGRGLFFIMHETAGITSVAALDIILFFFIMLISYFVICVVTEFKKTEKTKNDEQ